MFQKENEGVRAASQRRDRKGAKLTEGGNDYILKRYKLEENKLFKQKQNEDFKYQVKQEKALEEEEDIEEEEDDLVIVPLELPKCQQEPVIENITPPKAQTPDIFVFDDEEEEEGNSQPTYTYTESEKFKLQVGKKEQKQHFNEDQISLKSTHRYNYSTAELMTPKHIEMPRKKSEADPNEKLERLCRDEETGEKGEEEGLECLKGVKIGKQSNKSVSITITDKKVFSISKLPSGIILQCIIKRTSSILNLLSPEFDLYLANGLKHILSAKKYPLRNRELFKFSTDPLKFNDDNQLAVMHANLNHNIYWVLDQPRRIGGLDLSFIYLVIGYYKIKGEERHQRKFTALLPPTAKAEYQLAMDYELNSINFSNIKEEIKTEISNLQKWPNQQFNSTKNFVLADEDDPDYRYLEMKKQSDDVFELTIQHPLSPLQAMAIAMTRFDVQLK